MKCIVLDAMGVIFNAADDVAELLVPFVIENSGISDEEIINESYLAASLGEISADDFWLQVGLDSSLEDLYLSGHTIVRGLYEFIATASELEIPVWCLSNDVGRWSKKLRSSFDLNAHLNGAVISGDVGYRKPSQEIYELLVRDSGFNPRQMIFLDDREKNISAAKDFGIPSVLFEPSGGFYKLTEQLRAGNL